jgi:hypothetical protein
LNTRALLDALADHADVRGVEGALRALDPDDTRLGKQLWVALRADPDRVASRPATWRFLAQAPAGSFTAADVNIFLRAVSRAGLERLDPARGRIPWDPNFDTMFGKIADDRAAATLDDDVLPPLTTAVRVAMVRHKFAEPHTWGESTPHDWLRLLLPVWDRYPGYADEFTRFWPTETHGSLAVRVAAEPDTTLQTTDFLAVYAPYAHPEERVRIVLNVDSPHALERALAVLEEDHRTNMAVIFGNERKWWERIADDFGSALFGAHGIIGGPGVVGLLVGLAVTRFLGGDFGIFVLCIIGTFVVWRLVLALMVRPALPWEACRELATSELGLGLVAGWVVYRRSLAGKKVDPEMLETFFAGIRPRFPELGRPSRLRTVIELNLAELDRDGRTRAVLDMFDEGRSIENWAILEFSTSAEVARAAVDATAQFIPQDGEPGRASESLPIVRDALEHLAAHHQEVFLDALDEGRGWEELLVAAIGEARGDGVLDSLGRKLGDGSDAMREAIVTALANYGKAAIPSVMSALESEHTARRRDGAEVAWRLCHNPVLASAVSRARESEHEREVARLLTCVEIRHALARATEGVDVLDHGAMTLALDDALTEIGEVRVGLEPPVGLCWQTGTPLTEAAARGLARTVDAFDGADARLFGLLASIAEQLELESRDRWARELFASSVDPLAAISIAGPAATLALPATTDAIEALARMSTPAALIRLDGIAHDDPDPGLRRRAFRRLHQAAGARGLAVYDLFERAVLELPPEATIDPEVVRIVEGQAERVLSEAMVAGHRWRMEKWRELWADSPMFARLVGRLVWAIYDYGLLRGTFRLDESGEPVDVDDEAVALEPFTEIGLPVPSAFDRRLRERWGVLLADYEVLAPFPQMERDIDPKPYDDLVLDGAILRSLLSHGWYPSTPGLERHYGFLRPFPRLGLTASLEVSPGVSGDDDEPQTIDTLVFFDGIHSEFPSISRVLKDVPLEAQIQVSNELWLATVRGSEPAGLPE